MIAACPTRGWPTGFTGRRDAFLIVLTETLGYPHRVARELRRPDITVDAADDEARPVIAGEAVPSSDDPRTCPACAVVRWLEVLGIADGLGRGSARMALVAADAPTVTSAHQHVPSEPSRWRGAAVLLPAIDRHGWHDDYRPMTTRAIRARLAGAGARAGTGDVLDEPRGASPEVPDSAALASTSGSVEAAAELDEVLTMLDDLADDADALNIRIQALLTGFG